MYDRKKNNRKGNRKQTYTRDRKGIKDVDVQGRDFPDGNGVFSIPHQNDPAWWCKEPQLVKDAANLPYSWATGPDYAGSLGMTIPAVARLHTIPCPGISKDATSPINIAARRHYAYIRSANSGAKNYGPQDLIQYFMAMDSVYSYISYLTRIYGTMNLYSSENRFVPKWLLKAINIDHDDLAAHIPDLRSYINTLIYKAASFAVPKDMGIFERHIQLFGNYYSDYNNTRAQMYVFTPQVLYKWEEVNGKLLAQVLDSASALTFADLKTYGDNLINPIAASETASIMSGDIIKACGDAIIRLSTMKEDYTCIPMYSTEILIQVHNTVMVNSPVSGYDITQNAAQDTLIYDPVFNANANVGTIEANVLGGKKVIDVPQDAISPELNMVATRNVVTTVVDPSDATKYHLLSAGTEYITQMTMWSYNSSTGTVNAPSTVRTAQYTPNTIVGWKTLCTNAGLLSRFDWAPEVVPCFVDGSQQHSEPIRDITKMTVVSPENLARIHEVALLSAFVSPAIASTSSLK